MNKVIFLPGRKRSLHDGLSHRGFSLVEVVLALGIAMIGVLAIIGLLPVGLKIASDSLEETRAINILSEMIADRRATPSTLNSTLYSIPALNNLLADPACGTFGITDGNQILPDLGQARYRVDYQLTPPAQDRLDPYHLRLKVSWPAPAAIPSGCVEVVATFPHP